MICIQGISYFIHLSRPTNVGPVRDHGQDGEGRGGGKAEYGANQGTVELPCAAAVQGSEKLMFQVAGEDWGSSRFDFDVVGTYARLVPLMKDSKKNNQRDRIIV